MSPPFGPFARGGRAHRGPPPFIGQFLRLPLTINNSVALFMTLSVLRSHRADALAAADAAASVTKVTGIRSHMCVMMRGDPAYSMLAMFFFISIMHNVLSVARMRCIRKSVFGDKCPSPPWCRRRHGGDGEGEAPPSDDESRRAFRRKIGEIMRRMASPLIAAADLGLATGFLGLYIWTLLVANREGKVELSVGYANIGALVAMFLNLFIGFSSMKMVICARRQHDDDDKTEEGLADVKVGISEKQALLDN